MAFRGLPALALALCLLVAGCTAPIVPGTETGAPGTPDTSPSDGTAASPGTATGTSDETTNPWTNPVVIAIENRGEPGRNFTPLVRQATEYWEANDRRYLGYEVEFEVVPNAEKPDITMRFVANLTGTECGDHGDAAGCAPVINSSRQIDRPEPVWIKVGLSDSSTVLVIKHELGHALGLTHAAQPHEVMQARSVLYTVPQPNATERTWPWHDYTFPVYVDYSGAKNPSKARDQVGHALQYYEDGAPGMPGNITFTRTTNRTQADVVIAFADSSTCTDGSGSCGATLGTDPDGDGAIEIYRQVRITLVDLDTDAVAWHVGYWLAFAFGAEQDSEKPPPFQDASARERRSDWWE